LSFSMEGMVFDHHRGVILPDNGENGPDTGGYIARRYNEDAANPHGYISIEKGVAYPGLRGDYHIVVAAICDSRDKAKAQLKRFKPLAPSAYIVKTQIYMGCIH
jgi:hypothetical protein